MDIEFDPDKDAINREKHGVPLRFGEHVFEDPDHLVLATIRAEDGEERQKTLGLVGGRLWTAIVVRRGESTRFIPVRKSNDAEIRAYHRHPG
ncbi:MAG TPA: BrnT family toxin [Sphingomonas sp.]|uniref:BrnT family toxin n=1 Tax=Sphingomonas sp. TaxID=28214 RepID=UPI002EDB936A